jgi:hypothetical protein
MLKSAAGSTPLAYSSPEAVQTTGTVALPRITNLIEDVEGGNLGQRARLAKTLKKLGK